MMISQRIYQEQLRVQYLAQGYYDTHIEQPEIKPLTLELVGNIPQPSNAVFEVCLEILAKRLACI